MPENKKKYASPDVTMVEGLRPLHEAKSKTNNLKMSEKNILTHLRTSITRVSTAKLTQCIRMQIPRT